jgi:hypothetical protein
MALPIKSISGQPIVYALATHPLTGHDAPSLKEYMSAKRMRSTKQVAKKKRKTTNASTSAAATSPPDVPTMAATLIQVVQVHLSRFN